MELSKQLTVFVNGCFDVLHPGHLQLLSYAKSLGDKLIVALDADENVARNKPGRPIFPLEERMYMVSMIKPVDDVLSFRNSSELENLLWTLQPDIMVVGSDYKNKRVIGSEHTKELKFFDRIPDLSTTRIIESLRGR